MNEFIVKMISKINGNVEDDCVDDMIFNSESEAQEYASYMNSCNEVGSETLNMSNPGDYDEDYGEGEDYEYIVAEKD